MTPRDFAYWMQGGYEYGAGFSGHLTANEKQILTAHIEMSKATKGQYHPELIAFRTWVEAAIELDASHEKIKAKLHHLFEHVIDPMTLDAAEAVAQSDAHGMFGNGRPGMKC